MCLASFLQWTRWPPFLESPFCLHHHQLSSGFLKMIQAVCSQTACVLACWAECSTEAGRRADSSAQRSSAASRHPCTVWEKIKPFLFNWWIFVLLGTLSWLIYSNSATPEGENSFKHTSQHSAERRAKGSATQPRCSPSLVTLGPGH